MFAHKPSEFGASHSTVPAFDVRGVVHEGQGHGSVQRSGHTGGETLPLQSEHGKSPAHSVGGCGVGTVYQGVDEQISSSVSFDVLRFARALSKYQPVKN